MHVTSLWVEGGGTMQEQGLIRYPNIIGNLKVYA